MNSLELLNSAGSIYVKEVIPKSLCYFLTRILLKQASNPDSQKGDPQAPNSLIMSHEIVFETLLEQTWSELEELLGTKLLPTYAYARLYSNGDELKKHTDRDSCEVSMTLQLGRSHNYAWPIYMGNARYDLAEGDAILYRGCDVEHWREPCDGPDSYYSGQCFLHFVLEDGPRKNNFCDSSVRKPWKNMFVMDRSTLMDNK